MQSQWLTFYSDFGLIGFTKPLEWKSTKKERFEFMKWTILSWKFEKKKNIVFVFLSCIKLIEQILMY